MDAAVFSFRGLLRLGQLSAPALHPCPPFLGLVRDVAAPWRQCGGWDGSPASPRASRYGVGFAFESSSSFTCPPSYGPGSRPFGLPGKTAKATPDATPVSTSLTPPRTLFLCSASCGLGISHYVGNGCASVHLIDIRPARAKNVAFRSPSADGLAAVRGKHSTVSAISSVLQSRVRCLDAGPEVPPSAHPASRDAGSPPGGAPVDPPSSALPR
jgi:hypothetical protein